MGGMGNEKILLRELWCEEISQEEYEMYDGLCEECAWDEENDDLFLGGGW
jgi:hypothetical protein